MAIQTGGWRPATGGGDALARVASGIGRRVGVLAQLLLQGARIALRRFGRDLYHFITYGPLIRLVSKTLLTIPEETYSEPDMGTENFWKQFQIHEECHLKALLQVEQNVERMQGLVLGRSASLKHTLSNLLGDEIFEEK